MRRSAKQDETGGRIMNKEQGMSNENPKSEYQLRTLSDFDMGISDLFEFVRCSHLFVKFAAR